jgi:phosphohistidine phosphatase
MDVFLMQHGEAFSREVDPERSLNEEGVNHVNIAGKALAKLGVRLEWICSSPKRRAVQTAQSIGLALGLPDSAREIAEVLDPLSPPEEIIKAIAHKCEVGPILLAGHLPSLAELAAYLMDCQGKIAFRMAGVGCLLVEEWKRGGATLLWYLTPEQLERIVD